MKKINKNLIKIYNLEDDETNSNTNQDTESANSSSIEENTSSSSSSSSTRSKTDNDLKQNYDSDSENEDLKMNNLDNDPFRKAPFKYASASSSLTTSTNSLKATEQHKSAFQPYKRPEDPFTNAPFESNTKINPFVNAPYEVKKKQQNQFDYSKFGSGKEKKKKSKKMPVTMVMDDDEMNKEKRDKITNFLTQSQSLNNITANVSSIMLTPSVNSAFTSNISPSNCTGTITTTTTLSSDIVFVVSTTSTTPSVVSVDETSNKTSCTSFAMNMMDKTPANTSTTLTQSQLTIKQKSSTLPPLTIPLSAVNYNSTTVSTTATKLSTLPKCKNEIAVSNNDNEYDNFKASNFASTPMKLANASDSINKEFDRLNNKSKEKKEKMAAGMTVSTKSSTNTTPVKIAPNKGFSNMSFNDS
jgi:hypothetical protein